MVPVLSFFLICCEGNRVDSVLNPALERASRRSTAAEVDAQEVFSDVAVESASFRNSSGSSSSSRSSSSSSSSIGTSIGTSTSNGSSSSSNTHKEAARPPPPRTAVYRGRNPGGDRCVVADAPFPPLITVPWTLVRYGQASDRSLGGDISAGSASNKGAGGGTSHYASIESSSDSGSGGGTSNANSNKTAQAGHRTDGSIEGAICMSFCAYFEVSPNIC